MLVDDARGRLASNSVLMFCIATAIGPIPFGWCSRSPSPSVGGNATCIAGPGYPRREVDHPPDRGPIFSDTHYAKSRFPKIEVPPNHLS